MYFAFQQPIYTYGKKLYHIPQIWAFYRADWTFFLVFFMQDTCFFLSLRIFHASITNLHNNISDEYQEISILTIKTNQKFVKNNT